MPNTRGSQGFVAIFLLVMVLIGAVTGAIIGAASAGAVHLRWSALLAVLSAIIVIGIARSSFGKSFPKLFLAPRSRSIPLAVWISAVYYLESELSDTAALKSALTDFFLGPDEGLSLFVVCADVGIDVLVELLKACEGSAAE